MRQWSLSHIFWNDNNIPEPTWNISKANWPLFTSLCDQGIGEPDLLGSEDPVGTLTDILCTSASQAIPKTSPNPGNKPKPWYNDDCQRARSERIDTFKEFSKNPSGECLTKYKQGCDFSAFKRKSAFLRSKTWLVWITRIHGQNILPWGRDSINRSTFPLKMISKTWYLCLFNY